MVMSVRLVFLRVPLDLIGVCVGGAPMGGRGTAMDVLFLVGVGSPVSSVEVKSERFCVQPRSSPVWVLSQGLVQLLLVR